VKFPAYAPEEIKGIRVTEQGRREMVGNNIEERVDPRGFHYFWFGLGREVGLPGHQTDIKPGHQTDIKTVREKWISVTPLHLDLTHHETRETLSRAVDRSFD